MFSAFGACRDCARKEAGSGRERVTPLVYFWCKYPASTHRCNTDKWIARFVYQIDQAIFLLLRLKQGKILKNQRKPVSEWSMRLLRGRFSAFSGQKSRAPFTSNSLSKVVGKR